MGNDVWVTALYNNSPVIVFNEPFITSWYGIGLITQWIIVNTDCDPDRQRRDISTQVFDIGNTQINTVYEQLQNTVQLLSDKVNSQSLSCHTYPICSQVAGLEKETTCQFNGITFNEGEHWELSQCYACMCEVCNITGVN